MVIILLYNIDELQILMMSFWLFILQHTFWWCRCRCLFASSLPIPLTWAGSGDAVCAGQLGCQGSRADFRQTKQLHRRGGHQLVGFSKERGGGTFL